MRILVLSPRQCWPTDTGAKLREYHLVRQLAMHAEVTLLAFGAQNLAEGLPFCREVIVVPPPPRYTPVKLLRGLLGSQPVSVLNYTSDAMRQALEQLLGREQFDAVQIEASVMAGYAEIISSRPNAPAIVYDWHNIESELMRRFAEQAGSLPKRFYAAITARRLEALERGMLRSGATHIVCSQREQEQLRRIAPGAAIEFVPNGVDTSGFAGASNSAEGQPQSLVFVGSMNYHANVEGVLYFVERIWPELRRDFPQITLTLVGSSPTPAILALAGRPGIEVTGTVPDTKPYYSRASVAIVPLLTGGGTRLKILEAMAAGVPVLSTRLGAEGLGASPGEDIVIAETEAEWLTSLRRLLTDAPYAGSVAEKGLHLVHEKYDWRIPGETLARLYQNLIGDKCGVERSRN